MERDALQKYLLIAAGGALGHGLVDYGLGRLNRLGIHINLDGKC
jgi:hypothetical protein